MDHLRSRESGAIRFLCQRSFDRYLRWNADLPDDLVERIWRDPESLLANGVTLQEKLRSAVARVDPAVGPFVWKHYNWGNLRRTVKRSLSRSAARAAWIDGQFLHSVGVPTPRPRAYLERRFGPFRTCSYLLTDFIAGTTLYRLMRFERPTQEVVRHLAQQVAAIWQQLDDLRVCHRDFKTENLLVDPQGKLWLIDLDRMRRYRRQSQVRRVQVQDARDLLHPRNWRSDPGAAELFRQAILQTSAAADALSGPCGPAHPLRRPAPAANSPAQLVTVLIPCRNAAGTIAGCLESVRDMADEILVADAGSSDATVHVARGTGGCRILERSDVDAAEFENWAQQQARHPWILRVLPEERLHPELGRQVQDVLASEPAEDGFRVRRTDFLQRRPPRSFFLRRRGELPPAASIRLYRKDAAHYETRGGQAEVSIRSHKIGRLKAPLFCQARASDDRPELRDFNPMSTTESATAATVDRFTDPDEDSIQGRVVRLGKAG